jgi:hypothetical protein
MGGSSGCRPKAAYREEYNELKRRLGVCAQEDWAKAHYIFEDMCLLCDFTGPKGGSIGAPYPRCCRYCKYYGHSAQFCQVRKEREQTDYEKKADYYAPPTEAECSPEQWKWICELGELEARWEVANEHFKDDIENESLDIKEWYAFLGRGLPTQSPKTGACGSCSAPPE